MTNRARWLLVTILAVLALAALFRSGWYVLLFFPLVPLIGIVYSIWAVLDAAKTPESTWRAADQSQIVWVLVTLLLPVVGALAYAISVRPKLREIDRTKS